MHPQSLRAYLASLDAAGQLRRIAEPVDPVHEISAWFCLNGAGPALRFDKVTGHALPVIGNLLADRSRIALGLRVTEEGLQDRIVAAIRAPVDPLVVPDAPCQDVAQAQPDLAQLPVPTFFEHETGPYLTAGAIVARDPATGRANLSFARLKLLGGNRAMIGIAPNHHLAQFARRGQAIGRKLPIAASFGNHPAVLIAAALYLGLGEDELRVAGGLFGQAVEVAKTAHGLSVPAHCELVLEGELDAATLIDEGPVSEYHGMYECYGAGYLVEFSRLTRRRDALLQVIQPGYAPEHVWIGAEAIAASLANRLRERFSGLRRVAITPGSAGRLHAVASLEGGDAREFMAAVWDEVNLVKRVTVVDVGVDPWDPVAVEHAASTTMKPERDLLVRPAIKSNRSEPLEEGGMVGKLGIDARRKPADRDDWRFALPPAAVLARVRDRMK
jgi:2,5-furandicarboxylate decarboxylase 1